jgi:hypothetical protein
MPPDEISDYVVQKAGPVETAWIIVTLVAMGVVLLLVKMAIDNRRALLDTNTNGIRQYAADTQVIREILRFIILIPLLAVGVRSAWLPNYEGQRTWDYFFAIGCLMTVPVMMSVKGIVDWYRFTTLLKAVESQDFQTRIGDYGRTGADKRQSEMHPQGEES